MVGRRTRAARRMRPSVEADVERAPVLRFVAALGGDEGLEGFDSWSGRRCGGK